MIFSLSIDFKKYLERPISHRISFSMKDSRIVMEIGIDAFKCVCGDVW